ncbi:MAG: hypothetical protein LV471_09190 [Nitrosomonas sp.]|nr:hypothetical protein [Nitrosomonas sp.]
MNKLTIFRKDDLKRIIEEATIDQTDDQWIEVFLKGASNLIGSNPIIYRSFGPFWWVLKKYLQDENLNSGEPVDTDVFNQITMGEKILDIAAAYAYHDITTKDMTATQSTRTIESDDGTIDYTLIDEEMEAIIAFK